MIVSVLISPAPPCTHMQVPAWTPAVNQAGCMAARSALKPRCMQAMSMASDGSRPAAAARRHACHTQHVWLMNLYVWAAVLKLKLCEHAHMLQCPCCTGTPQPTAYCAAHCAAYCAAFCAATPSWFRPWRGQHIVHMRRLACGLPTQACSQDSMPGTVRSAHSLGSMCTLAVHLSCACVAALSGRLP